MTDDLECFRINCVITYKTGMNFFDPRSIGISKRASAPCPVIINPLLIATSAHFVHDLRLTHVLCLNALLADTLLPAVRLWGEPMLRCLPRPHARAQSYSLVVVGFRLVTFGDCVEAAEELKQVLLSGGATCMPHVPCRRSRRPSSTWPPRA